MLWAAHAEIRKNQYGVFLADFSRQDRELLALFDKAPDFKKAAAQKLKEESQTRKKNLQDSIDILNHKQGEIPRKMKKNGKK